VEIGVGILVSIPFTVTILLGGLSSVPGDIYEAARIDGASAWQQFRKLTLPLLRPFVNMAILLNVIYVFNSFPIIWVMTQGGPDESTHILVTYLYEVGFRLGRPGQAAAVSLIMLVMLFVFSMLYLRMQPAKEGENA
jgi:multiple sugar transport system permease protein